MGTPKRERQKELHRSRADEARRAAEAQARRRRILNIVAIAAVLVVVLVIVAIVADRDDDNATGGLDRVTTTTADSASEPTGAPPTTLEPNIAPAGIGCPPADGGAEHYTGFSEPLPMCIDPARTYTAEVETNLGTFTITLDARKAPKTVNNFVTLARFHYYDGLSFHRIIDGFMFQGGDPQGTGMGGPGYEFEDELPEAGEYELYSVAMANAGPNTNGSQFFVITGDAGVNLPPDYSLFGKVTDGTEVADAIGRVETDATDRPIEPVIMQKVTITES